MIGLLQLEELDHLLEELDQLARTGTPRAKFLAVILQRLRFLLSAQGSAYWVPIGGEIWKPLAVSGTQAVELPHGSLASLPEEGRVIAAGNDRFLAVPVQPQDVQQGAIVVLLSTELDSASIEQIGKFCRAVGEIISDFECSQQQLFLTTQWPVIQRMLSQITRTESIDEAAVLIVNSLQISLGAQRVALAVSRDSKSSKVLAVSGIPGEIKNTTSLMELRYFCQNACDSNQAVIIQPGAASSDPDPVASGLDRPVKSLAPYLAALPIRELSTASLPQKMEIADSKGMPRCDTAICLEWKDYEDFLHGIKRLALAEPAVTSMWYAQRRWLGLPAWVRGLGRFHLAKLGKRHSSRFLRWLAIAGLVGLVAWLLTRPTEMRIEMQGVLQPTSQRTVFAALDGVVDQLLIQDNAMVKQGQTLLTMKSANLEMSIQETMGELQANQEKLDAFKVSLNQLNREDKDQASAINRVAAEIGQLETQRETLQKKLEAYRSENLKLTLSAPIDGLVIAHDLEALLDSRPVRRGDALLRVVQTSGPWHLVLSIADRDIGYVKNARFSANEQVGNRQLSDQKALELDLDYVFSSTPDHQHRAKLVWLSPAARNPRGDGVFVEAHAEVDRSATRDTHVGATVYAYLNVGKYPIWFVWSRPLIEAVQRKLWFATLTEASK